MYVLERKSVLDALTTIVGVIVVVIIIVFIVFVVVNVMVVVNVTVVVSVMGVVVVVVGWFVSWLVDSSFCAFTLHPLARTFVCLLVTFARQTTDNNAVRFFVSSEVARLSSATVSRWNQCCNMCRSGTGKRT